jgi:flagellin
MGFRINNNISALVAQTNLHKTQGNLSKSIERLSSGLRINRGADDAAGLTISEKLRGQIRGLNRAVANAQDGISLIQTAEGALSEDASILNRLRELAIQSQSDSLTSSDRLELQKEVDQLVDEVDRISSTTEFNTKKLLDGSANALVSTDHSDLNVYQTGDAGRLSAGNYEIDVLLQTAGEKQVQKSAILRDSSTGNTAGLGSKLKDLESFYDNSGNSVLESPQTITVRGNGSKSDVTVSSDMTVQQFANAMEDAISGTGDGQLGISGSTFAFDATAGQIIFESGRDGQAGEISIAANEDIVRALGLQITTESEAAAYKVTATTTGATSSTTTSANTTTDTATGVIDGLALNFEVASEARKDGSIAMTEAVYITGTAGTDDVVFTIHDTNAFGNGQEVPQLSNGVTVTLTAGRAYSTASISAVVNSAVAVTTDTNHALSAGGNFSWATARNPGISASMDGYNLVLSSAATGTSGTISVAANTEATQFLGLQTGKVTGSGGENAVLVGTVDISEGITFSSTDTHTALAIGDGDFNISSGSDSNHLLFLANTAISGTSVVDTFNSYFSSNSIGIQASMNSAGKLELRSTETGSDTKISIAGYTAGATATDSDAAMVALGLIDGQNDTGSNGNAAVYTGQTAESAQTVGFAMTGFVGFSVTDKAGASSGTITLGVATTTVDPDENFTIAKEQVVSLIGGSDISTTDIGYKFDAGNRLDFFSKSAGEGSRIVFKTTDSSHNTIAINSLGIDMNTATQGSGKTNFNLHVADRSLKFQIGANKSQHLDFSLINSSAEALGLKGLDVTNIKSATRALGSIDGAVSSISAERSKLGSLQNRLNSTINNLGVTATNLQSTESKIRDVDIAKETVDFTRNQILMQAGTAQLAQSKGLSQTALQLLG